MKRVLTLRIFEPARWQSASVLEIIQALPDDCSPEEIAALMEFMATGTVDEKSKSLEKQKIAV